MTGLRTHLGAGRARAFRRTRTAGLAAIGDSITSGHGKPHSRVLAADSWVTYATAGLPFTGNAARPNQTTEQVAAQLPAILALRPRLVCVLAGINDIRRGESGRIDGIVKIVEAIRAGGARPVLATLPPYEPGGERLLRFNADLRDFAADDGIPLLDFYRLLDGRYDALSTDGLHPSVRGARVMGQHARPTLRSWLR